MSVDSVSFVTLTKNRPRLLAEAGQSIVSQLRTTAMQWVVVNNGGRSCRNDCEEIVRGTDVDLIYVELSEISPRSEGTARNRGLSAADGAWVGFLDDDDLLLPRHTDALLSAADSSSRAIVYGGALLADHAEGIVESLVASSRSAFRFPYVPDMLGIADYLTINAPLVDRDLLADVQLEESADFSNVFDWDF